VAVGEAVPVSLAVLDVLDVLICGRRSVRRDEPDDDGDQREELASHGAVIGGPRDALTPSFGALQIGVVGFTGRK
jgi:hypothetical protein